MLLPQAFTKDFTDLVVDVLDGAGVQHLRLERLAVSISSGLPTDVEAQLRQSAEHQLTMLLLLLGYRLTIFG